MRGVILGSDEVWSQRGDGVIRIEGKMLHLMSSRPIGIADSAWLLHLADCVQQCGSQYLGGRTLVTESSPAFVSYSRADADFALKLAEDLKNGGANIWLDQLDIEPGERWARAVQAALKAAPRVLVILSPASVSSNNVEDEIAFALDKRKSIIPIMSQDCEIPFQLVPFQYVDFRTDYGRGLGRLLKTLAVQSPVASAPSAAVTVVAPAASMSMDDAAAAPAPSTLPALSEEERTLQELTRRAEGGDTTAMVELGKAYQKDTRPLPIHPKPFTGI